MASGKKYGLIIPNSKNAFFAKKNVSSTKPSVFGNDSSSDEDAHKEVNAQIHREALKKKIQKQTKIEIQKALEQDSTVYEYDSIYDDMKEKSKKKIPAGVAIADKQRKPKYIDKLMKAAEKRVKEKERIEERKIQREREKEGNEFEDKEEFVTSAYRQKMLERQKDIEEEKRMDAIEEALDVRKQKDMTGFYRNFLNRELCKDPSEGSSAKLVKDTPSEEPQISQSQEDEDTDLSFSSSDEDEQDTEKRSLMPEKRQTSNEREIYKSKEKQHLSHPTNESHSQRRSRGHDERSLDYDYRRRHSPSRNSHRHDRDRQSRRRSSEDRHQRKKHERIIDEQPRKRDRSEDRLHRKRRKRDGRDRSRSRSTSPPRNSSHDRKSMHTEHSANVSPMRGDKDNTSNKLNSANPDAEKAAVIDDLVGPVEEVKPSSSFAKRTDDGKALSARERYLARKAAQTSRPVIEDSD